MNNSPLLSVVVAVYNIEEYIDRCLKSLACCEEQRIEIIIIDDGSTDKSSGICERYTKADERFLLVHKKNGGLSSARNTGISMANGEYVIFIDGDDYVIPEAMNSFINWLDKNKEAEVVCNDYYRCESNKCSEISQVKRMKEKTFENALVFGKGFWNVWRYCYKRDTIIQGGLLFKEGYLCEDVDFTTKTWMSVKKSEFISMPFYCYQAGRINSIMYRPNPQRTQDLIFIIGDLLDNLNSAQEQDKAYGIQTRLFKEYVLALPQIIDNGGKNSAVGKNMRILLDRFCDCPPVKLEAKVIRFFGIGFCARVLYIARKVKNM